MHSSDGSKAIFELKDFLECFPPPTAGRIVEGFIPDDEVPEEFDLIPGTVLSFHRSVSPHVPLSFKDPWGGPNSDHYVKVTLPLEFQGKFTLLPYNPETEDTSEDYIYDTVEDLVKTFPVYAKVNKRYDSKRSDPDQPEFFDCSLNVGDRIKLLRLVHKQGYKLLECRLIDEAQLRLLPMFCEGNFTVLPDYNEYILSDLMNMVPRKRLLRVAENSAKIYKIPGLPPNFNGDLYLEEPDAFVEASPINDPGLIIGLPSNLEVTVTPEEQAYDQGVLISAFAKNNRQLFPVVVRVSDWQEETAILENHSVKPGIELVIHGWTRQSKILAETSSRCYAIPLTYTGRFHLKPPQYHGTAELERAHPAYSLRVIKGDPDIALSVGDVIRMNRNDSDKSKKGKSKNGKNVKNNKKVQDGDIEFLKCEKYDKMTEKFRELKLPMASEAIFEEINDTGKKSDDYQIKELLTFVTEHEIAVQLIHGSTDQKLNERDLPMGEPITLCDFIVEPAVYVSVETAEAPAFHIPLRTLMHVQFVQQLNKSASPLLTRNNPRLSTLDRCVEYLPVDVFQALQPHTKGFEDPMAPLTNGSDNGKWNAPENGHTSQSSKGKKTWSSSSFAYEVVAPTQHPIIMKDGPQTDFNANEIGKVSSRFNEQSNRVANQNGNFYDSRSLPRHVVQQSKTNKFNTVGANYVAQHRMHQPVYVEERSPSPVPSVSAKSSISVAQSVPAYAQGQGGGFVLMPVGKQPRQIQVPPGYMLVPVSQLQQSPRKAQSMAGSVIDDGTESEIEYSDSVSQVGFRMKPKVSIPADGNLYHLSAKKLAEVFRQLNVSEEAIRLCLKNKIDGKKFSRVTNADMVKLGLLQPGVLQLRQTTRKVMPKFML